MHILYCTRKPTLITNPYIVRIWSYLFLKNEVMIILINLYSIGCFISSVIRNPGFIHPDNLFYLAHLYWSCCYLAAFCKNQTTKLLLSGKINQKGHNLPEWQWLILFRGGSASQEWGVSLTGMRGQLAQEYTVEHKPERICDIFS